MLESAVATGGVMMRSGSGMPRVVLDRVSVSFPVLDAPAKSLRASLRDLGNGGPLQSDREGRVAIAALSQVSLDVASGDRVALIGRNGAGKSTLLRVIAGIYQPSEGKVSVQGRLSALLAPGLVYDEELTGWEAIEYGCLLRGIPRSRVAALCRDVAAFTELGDHLSLPVRTYSAGMKVRLSFGIATCDAPDVLLVDEAIAAGDVHFMEKARHRARSFVERSSIVFLASHSEDVLLSICNKGVLLDRGKIVVAGPIAAVLRAYRSVAGPNRAGG